MKTNNEIELENLVNEFIKVLDIKCRKGCDPQKDSWVGFENGNGEECGKKIERLIQKAKRVLMRQQTVSGAI